jgi:hypothetical protein
MATGIAAAAPSLSIADVKITTAPVGSTNDTITKQTIEAIGTQPLPNNTLQGEGQGIYSNILA